MEIAIYAKKAQTEEKQMIQFAAYENNAGSVALFILDGNGIPITGFGNFEYTFGSLADAISNINDYRSFDGEFGRDIKLPIIIDVDVEHFEFRDRELTIYELYLEWANDDTDTMIAWSDGNGVNYCDVNRMGHGARYALAIVEDIE